MKQDAWKQPFFSDKMPACALKGHWASFCLVDETGSGKAYGGLPYTLYDSTGRQYDGRLDGDGFARLQGFYCGPVVLNWTVCIPERKSPITDYEFAKPINFPSPSFKFGPNKPGFLPRMASALRATPHNRKQTGFIKLK